MKMFARFDENPAMTLQDIKKTKRYGQTDGRTHARTDNMKTVYPPQTKFAGVYQTKFAGGGIMINLHENMKQGRDQELETPGPAVRHTTDCATRPSGK